MNLACLRKHRAINDIYWQMPWGNGRLCTSQADDWRSSRLTLPCGWVFCSSCNQGLVMAVSPSWQGKVEPPHYRCLTRIEASENLHNLWATHDPFSHLPVTATLQQEGEMRDEIKNKDGNPYTFFCECFLLNPMNEKQLKRQLGL